jgi:hypothetical protein
VKTIGLLDRWQGIEAFNDGTSIYVIEAPDDYSRLPAPLQDFVTRREAWLVQQMTEAAVAEAFDAERSASLLAEFAAFKARAGQPSYKAAAVHVAAEKLGVMTAIEAAIDTLISQAGDKALAVWWQRADAISRGDAQWQQIEPAVAWGKGVTPEQLFELAARV